MGIRHNRPRLASRGRHRAKRAQTFSSEAKAKVYAQKNGIKSFDVVRMNAGLSRKFKIVSK